MWSRILYRTYTAYNFVAWWSQEVVIVGWILRPTILKWLHTHDASAQSLNRWIWADHEKCLIDELRNACTANYNRHQLCKLNTTMIESTGNILRFLRCFKMVFPPTVLDLAFLILVYKFHWISGIILLRSFIYVT